jgi:hypothetical protein
MVRALRRQDRIDQVGESVATLALTTSVLVDRAVAEGGPLYAIAKLGVLHLGVLAQLAKMYGPAPNDEWDQLLTVLSTPTRPESVYDAPPPPRRDEPPEPNGPTLGGPYGPPRL